MKVSSKILANTFFGKEGSEKKTMNKNTIRKKVFNSSQLQVDFTPNENHTSGKPILSTRLLRIVEVPKPCLQLVGRQQTSTQNQRPSDGSTVRTAGGWMMPSEYVWVLQLSWIFFVEYACHQPNFSESHDKSGYEKAKWLGLLVFLIEMPLARWKYATWVNCKTSQTRNLMLNGCLCYLSHYCT